MYSKRFRKELYETYSERLRDFIYRYVASQEIAEDLMHDVFIKVFENPTRFALVRNWESYIFKIARNHTLDFLKRNSLTIKYVNKIKAEFREEDSSLSQRLQEKEYFEFLNECLENLPEKSRMIFGLCREEDQSYLEVAQKLGISKSTVKHHMVFAMKKIRSEVEEHFNISTLTSPSRNG